MNAATAIGLNRSTSLQVDGVLTISNQTTTAPHLSEEFKYDALAKEVPTSNDTPPKGSTCLCIMVYLKPDEGLFCWQRRLDIHYRRIRNHYTSLQCPCQEVV